jgi:hypothetical protein
MTTFYVGQRVRIKWSHNWPELAGQDGIVEGYAEGPDIRGIEGAILVAPTAWGTSMAPRPSPFGATQFGPQADQLEPILYDGNKTVEWSECLWQPSHQGAPA